MGRRIDLTGQRFGRLVVESFAYADKSGHSVWNCKCDCGKVKKIEGLSLKNGKTKSCGCFRKEIHEKLARENFTTHGKTSSRLFSIWSGMIKRTERKDNVSFKYYGGRGIEVCHEWRSDFQKFYDWAMSHGYKENLTIDRIDNDEGYNPKNCRWRTIKQQGRNRRNNHLISYNGVTKTLAEWAEHSQIRSDTLYDRLKRGWTIEKALETPVDKRKSHKKK